MHLTDEHRAAFAQAMGMKMREILAVEEVPGGYAVTTHDHKRTLVDEFGRVAGAAPVVPAPAVSSAPAAAESVQEDPPEPQSPAQDLDGGQDPDGGESPGLRVPEGSEREVLAWVDGDADRAAAALGVEEARETPRKGLLGKLRQLAG